MRLTSRIELLAPITEGCGTLDTVSKCWFHHDTGVATPAPLVLSWHVLSGLRDVSTHGYTHIGLPYSVAHWEKYLTTNGPLLWMKKVVWESREPYGTTTGLKDTAFPDLTIRQARGSAWGLTAVRQMGVLLPAACLLHQKPTELSASQGSATSSLKKGISLVLSIGCFINFNRRLCVIYTSIKLEKFLN